MKIAATLLALVMAPMVLAETLIFEDNFDKLDFKRWQHELTMGGGGNWEFQVYRNNRTNSFIDEGVLHIQPSLTIDYLGEATMKGGDFAIWGGAPADTCTSNAFYGCERNAAYGNYINPVMSARLRSVNSFSFTYGRLEVVAKLPKGDMIWPAIWLLPADLEYGTWPASGEIDLMESRGSDASYCKAGGNNAFASTLHWGPNWDQNRYELTTAQYVHPTSLGDDFHTYGLLWTEDRLMTYIDDESNVVLDLDLTQQSFWERGGFGAGVDNPWKGEPNSAPFNRDFYLIFNVAVGGTNGYFPDHDCGKTYRNDDGQSVNTFWNSADKWLPTWNYPATHDSALKIDSVRVWSLDGAEQIIQ